MKISIWQCGFARDSELRGNSSGLGEAGSCEGLATPDPCFDFAGEDAVLPRSVYDAQIAVAEDELHSFLLAAVEMNSRESG